MLSSESLTVEFVTEFQSQNPDYICAEDICHGDSKCLKIENFEVCICKSDFYGELCQFAAAKKEQSVAANGSE